MKKKKKKKERNVLGRMRALTAAKSRTPVRYKILVTSILHADRVP